VEYINAKEKISTLGNLPSVQDIVDVFLEGFLGLSPKRDIDFTIEIVPIIALVSRALYHMSVPELTELKNATASIIGEEIHSFKLVTLGSSSSSHQEEGWKLEIVY